MSLVSIMWSLAICAASGLGVAWGIATELKRQQGLVSDDSAMSGPLGGPPSVPDLSGHEGEQLSEVSRPGVAR